MFDAKNRQTSPMIIIKGWIWVLKNFEISDFIEMINLLLGSTQIS